MLLKDHINSAVLAVATATAPTAAKSKVIQPQVDAEIEKQAKRIKDTIEWEGKFEGAVGSTYPRGTGFLGADGKEERKQSVAQANLKKKLDELEKRYKSAIVLAFPELDASTDPGIAPNFGELDKLLKEPIPTLKEATSASAGDAPSQ